MAWRDTLARLIHGESDTPPHGVIPELQKAHASLARQAEQLRRHAQASPNQLNLQHLTALAQDEQDQARRLVETLAGHGATPDSEGIPAVSEGALNHWGRLGQDLEAHRTTARHLREQAIYFSGTQPAIAKLFGDLAHREDAHALRLRDLIARADPQAIN
jgi:rubrerythrin